MLSASKIFIVLLCLSACTGGNSIAIARGLSPHTGGQIVVYLLRISINVLPAYPGTNKAPVDNLGMVGWCDGPG